MQITPAEEKNLKREGREGTKYSKTSEEIPFKHCKGGVKYAKNAEETMLQTVCRRAYKIKRVQRSRHMYRDGGDKFIQTAEESKRDCRRGYFGTCAVCKMQMQTDLQSSGQTQKDLKGV